MTERKHAGPFRWAARIVSALAAVFVLIIVMLTVGIPAVRGWVPLTIASGSMEPTYPVGSMVIGDPVSAEESRALVTGDVITFMPYPDDPALVTHRIIGVSSDSEGTTLYTTQGDANGAPDPEPVADYQVRAVVQYHVPYVGYVANWLDGNEKQTIIYGVIGALALYCAYQLIAGARERRMQHA